MKLEDLEKVLNEVEGDTDTDKVSVAVMVYKEAGTMMAELTEPHKKLRDGAKAVIQGVIDRTGITNWSNHIKVGKAYFTPEKETVRYDTKVLERVLGDPAVSQETKTLLRTARIESTRKGSLTVG